MDQQKLLSNDQLRVGLDLVRRFSESYPVEAAFWFNHMDDGQFFLNIASRSIDQSNHMEARGVLVQIVSEIDSFYLDPSAINLISVDDPVTQKAISLRHGYVGITRSTSHKLFFRGAPLYQLYVYSEQNLRLGVLR